MGAGQYPVGYGPAGFDPTSITAPTATLGGRAMYFDLITRDVPVDADGNYLEMHPIDSQVMVALGIQLGSVLSAPLVGSTIANLPIDDSVPMTAEANRRVQAALSDLIANGDVALVLVNAYAGPSWRAHIEIIYQNLRLPSQDAQNQQKLLLVSGM